jgi:hypothetical protein
VTTADATVAPYGVHVSEASDPSLATTVITISPTSPAGSASDGVLGCESPSAITLVSGWNWYTGSNPAQVGQNQYDFETIVLHEIGHSLGLGHSQDPVSVMLSTLETGQAKRSLVAADLDIPDTDAGPCPLHAATDAGLDLAASTVSAAPASSDAAPQEPVEGDIPLTPDTAHLGRASSPPKADAAGRVQQAATGSRQTFVSIRTRPSARRNTVHDLAIDHWRDAETDWLDGIAREVARRKAAKVTTRRPLA